MEAELITGLPASVLCNYRPSELLLTAFQVLWQGCPRFIHHPEAGVCGWEMTTLRWFRPRPWSGHNSLWDLEGDAFSLLGPRIPVTKGEEQGAGPSWTLRSHSIVGCYRWPGAYWNEWAFHKWDGSSLFWHNGFFQTMQLFFLENEVSHFPAFARYFRNCWNLYISSSFFLFSPLSKFYER